MNRFAKTIALTGLVVALGTTTLTGCGDTLDGSKTVAACKDEKVTVGTANMLLRMNQAQMASYYAMFGGSTAGIWDQEGEDGKTYGENTKDDVMEQIHNMVLLKQHAADYDVTISEEEQQKIKDAAAKFMESNSEETIEKLAVSQSDIEKVLEYYTYQNKMFDPMTADVDTNVEDSEAAQSKITYCSVSIEDKEDDEGNAVALTDEEKQEKKDQAQEILDKLNAQEDPAQADMDALAKEVDETLASTVRTFGSDDTSLDDKLKEAVKDLSDGQVAPAVVEGEKAFYVVRMDKVLDEESTQSKKDSIVSDRKQEAYDKLLEDWGKEDKLTVEKSVWKKVKLTDADSYTMKQQEAEEQPESGTEDTGSTDNAGDTDSADNAGDTTGSAEDNGNTDDTSGNADENGEDGEAEAQ